MFRRAIISGGLVFCALTAMGSVGVAAAADGPDYKVEWARNPWDRGNDRPDKWVPISRGNSQKEFAIPSGRCYTGVVIVPSRTTGFSQRLRLVEGRSEFPIVVQGGQTFVLPFAKGWKPDCRACIVGDLCDGDFEVWGITDDGPVSFECSRR